MGDLENGPSLAGTHRREHLVAERFDEPVSTPNRSAHNY
jgi:hypothetical protein